MSVSGVTEIRAVSLRLPVPVLLAATVLVTTALHAALALRISSPWIVPDELIYSELAKSLGDGGLPRIRGDVSFAYGLGYPALLAPVWAVFEDVTTAYAVAKIVNALILGLTAVPAYFLARRFVAEVPALLVAMLSVAVPSMLYAGTLMTEVALYPAFVLSLLAFTLALERPSPRNQLLALGAIAFAILVKPLALVLLPAYVASIVAHAWLDEGRVSREALQAFRTTWIALGAFLAVELVVVELALGVRFGVLGAYSGIADHVNLTAVPWWVLLHLAELDLYLAVIPFAAALVVIWRGVRRDADRRERLFAAVTVPVGLALVTLVAAFASTPSPGGVGYPENVARLHERGMFVLAPLFLIGLMLALTGPALPRRRLVVTGVVAASLPSLIPLERFLDNAAFQALALVPWIEERDLLMWPFGCLVMTGALAMLYVARARIGLIIASVAAVFLATTLTAYEKMDWSSNWTKDRAWGEAAGWIDRVAGDATVSVLWAESGDGRFVEQAPRHRVLWLGELFNRSVGPVYELGTPMPYGLPSTPVRLDDGGRVVLAGGRSAQLGDLVLAPCHVQVAGVPIARDPSTGAAVVRVRGPVRATIAEPGSCPGGSVS